MKLNDRMPVTESLLRKTAMLIRLPPPETESWTNDRHLLAAVALSTSPGAVRERFATIK